MNTHFPMFLDDASDTLRSGPIDRRRSLPSTRTAQLSPVSLVSLLYTLSLYVLYQHGFIHIGTFTSMAILVVGCAAMFYALFRLGVNKRFRDQSMVLPQIVVTLLAMLSVAYIERATQIALVPFVLIAFSFGIFRLSTMMLVLLAACSLAAYLGIIVLHGNADGYTANFHADLMQWCVLALSLPGMILVGKQIQNLHQLLHLTRHQLKHYEEKSAHDELTGLYNRGRIQLELKRIKRQADTRGMPFSICLIDIDHFKEINDRNGHLAGDIILREFCRMARDSIRDTDLLGRYGGDEFLLILPDTDLKGAVMHAERLRVRAHFIDFQKVLEQKHISLSIGVAQYRSGDSITDLIARADAALYQSKELGRNRVEWKD